MKKIDEITKRLVQLEDDILYNRFDKYTNFYLAAELRNADEMRGAMLALKWVLEDDENTDM